MPVDAAVSLLSIAVVVALFAIGGLTAYAVRPAGRVVASLRLALVRAAVILAAVAIAVVELASAIRALTVGVVAVFWLVGLVIAVAAAWLRHRHDPARVGDRSAYRDRARAAWECMPGPDRAIAVVIGAVMSGILLIAVVSAPNTYDSLTYHLPRIEHWVAQSSVAFYPTSIHRQVTHSPGHEYLLTHVRLLTGDDRLYGVLQWLAALGGLLAVTRIAAQFGGARRAQLIAALTVVSTPIWVMHASGTGNDIILTTWVAVAATLVLDGVRERARPGDVVLLGLTTGLVAITKNNGLLAVAPLLLLWGISQLRLGRGHDRPLPPWRYATTAGASVGVLLIAVLVVGPFTARMIRDFGTPLGPPDLRNHIPMQRHDPAAVLVNGLRIALTALDTPVRPLSDAGTRIIDAAADGLGLDSNDPGITFKENRFPTVTWYPIEDLVSFPLQAVLGFLAVGWAVVRPRTLAFAAGDAALGWPLRAYGGAIIAGGVLFAATVKWSFSVNRLTMFLLILAAPLIGLWLTALLRVGRRPCVAFVAGVLALATVTGTMAVLVGYPRGLAGRGSVFVGDRVEKNLVRRAVLEDDYRWVADRIRATGAQRVGLIQWGNDYEYPWYHLLPARRFVNLISVLDRHPAPEPQSVDAWICTTERWQCEELLPAGWRYEYGRYAGYAVPSG
jgi:hypothetical protein